MHFTMHNQDVDDSVATFKKFYIAPVSLKDCINYKFIYQKIIIIIYKYKVLNAIKIMIVME